MEAFLPDEIENVIVGLDIGTSKTAICVGTTHEGLVDVLALEMVPNSGMRKGMVSDIEDTTSSISAALEEAEKASQVPIKSVFTSISGNHITSANSKGVIAVSRADGEITDADLDRVIEAARAVALPPNQEILHIIPKTFTVDGQEGIKDPVGMNGVRLETDALVVGGSSSAIRNLQKSIIQTGVGINDMIYSPLALAKILLNKKQKELGVLLIDLGAGTTTMTVFEEGDVIHTAVYPAGSLNVTNDVAIGLKTSLEIAEQIKQKEGITLLSKIRESEVIDMYKYDPNIKERIKKKYLAEILEARLSEIFGFIKNELRKIGKDGLLPAGIVFSGGGGLVSNVLDFAKDFLKLPAQLGIPNTELTGRVERINHPQFALASGLMLWGMEEGFSEKPLTSALNFGKVGGVVERAKQFFKQLIP